MKASERYKIALNILAKVGLDGNLQEEYAKTMNALHSMDSMNAIQSQLPPVIPSEVSNVLQPTQTGAEAPMSNQSLQTPNPMTEGQGSLNLP